DDRRRNPTTSNRVPPLPFFFLLAAAAFATAATLSADSAYTRSGRISRGFDRALAARRDRPSPQRCADRRGVRRCGARAGSGPGATGGRGAPAAPQPAPGTVPVGTRIALDHSAGEEARPPAEPVQTVEERRGVQPARRRGSDPGRLGGVDGVAVDRQADAGRA